MTAPVRSLGYSAPRSSCDQRRRLAARGGGPGRPHGAHRPHNIRATTRWSARMTRRSARASRTSRRLRRRAARRPAREGGGARHSAARRRLPRRPRPSSRRPPRSARSGPRRPAVGMSTVPEAIVPPPLRAAGRGGPRVTNLAEGMGEVALSHEQTLEEGKKGAAALGPLLRRVGGDPMTFFAQELIRRKRDGCKPQRRGTPVVGRRGSPTAASPTARPRRSRWRSSSATSSRAERVDAHDRDARLRQRAELGSRRARARQAPRPAASGTRSRSSSRPCFAACGALRADDLGPGARPHRRDARQARLDPGQQYGLEAPARRGRRRGLRDRRPDLRPRARRPPPLRAA